MIKNKNITLNQSVSQVEGNIVSDMGGEKVMLNVENGKYYNLGEIGGDIWNLLSEPVQVSQVVSKLISIYDVGQTQCEGQVLSFLEVLYDEGLIAVK